MKHFESTSKMFSEIMKKSKLEMPFDDFEDNVMLKIYNGATHNSSFTLDIKLSFFFFFLGTCLGLVLNFILIKFHVSFFGISSENILLIFQVFFILLFLTQLDYLIKVLKKIN